MTQTLTDMILSKLLPKIQHGLHSGEVTLNASDCEDILRLFKVSVSIETLVEHMVGLIHNTLSGDDRPFSPPHDEGHPDDFDHVTGVCAQSYIETGNLDPKKSR